MQHMNAILIQVIELKLKFSTKTNRIRQKQIYLDIEFLDKENNMIIVIDYIDQRIEKYTFSRFKDFISRIDLLVMSNHRRRCHYVH